MTILVNGAPVASLRWSAPWSGVWVAELELQHGLPVAPSGKVAIGSPDGLALVGTVDDEESGAFGEKRHLRVLGGGAGWRKSVRAQHYHSDVGLPLASIVATTAAEAGEVAAVLVPSVVGTDFVRRAGPAAQIFLDAGVDWWVGLDGVTRVGKRLPLPPPASLEIQDWDPGAGTLRFTASVLVEPGTILVDARFGRRVVRTVEAEISGTSVKGTLWVAAEGSPAGSVSGLVDTLGALARAATGSDFARLYEYRVVAMQGDRVELQAVRRSDGVPDILPASVWAGASGYRAVLRPASRVLVGFVAGDSKQPYVAAYEPPEAGGWRPLQLEIDALGTVTVGEQSFGICLGALATAQPVARSTGILAALTAIAAYAQALAVLDVTTQPAATALAAALAPLALTIPSTKVVSQ